MYIHVHVAFVEVSCCVEIHVRPPPPPKNVHSFRFATDIALLNLANILHRSKQSEDATIPLLVAISLSPNVNVLHYTLGNIYAVSAKQLYVLV